MCLLICSKTHLINKINRVNLPNEMLLNYFGYNDLFKNLDLDIFKLIDLNNKHRPTSTSKFGRIWLTLFTGIRDSYFYDWYFIGVLSFWMDTKIMCLVRVAYIIFLYKYIINRVILLMILLFYINKLLIKCNSIQPKFISFITSFYSEFFQATLLKYKSFIIFSI